MTDRELLELAAKAAGIDVTAVVADGIPHRFGGGYWNPLTDDGDALRLAVRLSLLEEHPDFAYKLAEESGHPHDPTAATRRAIVRAAAEIGKTI